MHPVPTRSSEVLALMKLLGLPHQFPRAVMQTIADKEGRHFALALADIANDNDPTKSKRDYVDAICSAVAPITLQVAKDLGFSYVTRDQLIDISKEEGRIFRTSISKAKSSLQAQSYLEQVLAASGASDFMGSTFVDRPADASPVEVVQSAPSFFDHLDHDDPGHQHPQESESIPVGRPSPRLAPTPVAESRPAHYETFHIYGGKCAFCFAMDTTRSENQPTIRIEAARLIRPRTYDWKSKVGLQLRVPELTLVYGVLTGLVKAVDLTNHGLKNEKALSIQDQGESIFFSLRIRDSPAYALPAPASETLIPITMILRQLKANMPGLDAQSLNQTIGIVCSRYAKNKNAHAA